MWAQWINYSIPKHNTQDLQEVLEQDGTHQLPETKYIETSDKNLDKLTTLKKTLITKQQPTKTPTTTSTSKLHYSPALFDSLFSSSTPSNEDTPYSPFWGGWGHT